MNDSMDLIKTAAMWRRLVITNVDVQSVEPVDVQTRESLQKSVTLAIEITTKSQEAASQHQVGNFGTLLLGPVNASFSQLNSSLERCVLQADEEEEIAEGALTTQRLKNKSDAEAFRKLLLSREAECMAIAQQGVAGPFI